MDVFPSVCTQYCAQVDVLLKAIRDGRKGLTGHVEDGPNQGPPFSTPNWINVRDPFYFLEALRLKTSQTGVPGTSPGALG